MLTLLIVGGTPFVVATFVVLVILRMAGLSSRAEDDDFAELRRLVSERGRVLVTPGMSDDEILEALADALRPEDRAA
jgi:hypothetical protein